MEPINGLQSWYLAQCNGYWEHQYGVRIDTLDNPGWSLTIDLEGTALVNMPFADLAHGVSDDAEQYKADWLICRVIGSKFEGRGGPEKLNAMINVFLKWAST